MVQVLADVVMVEVVVLLRITAFPPSANASLYIVILILLLGISRPARIGADGTPYQGRRIQADGPSSQYQCRWPMLADGDHLQRHQGPEVVGKRSAVSGSPAELASPIRLGSTSAHRPAEAGRTAHIKGKRYGRQWPAEPSTDSHQVYPPNP